MIAAGGEVERTDLLLVDDKMTTGCEEELPMRLRALSEGLPKGVRKELQRQAKGTWIPDEGALSCQ
jgi:hypothetical protein